jgi:hypothetical protein
MPSNDNNWPSNDFDFFVMDTYCDTLMETKLDKYLSSRQDSMIDLDLPLMIANINVKYQAVYDDFKNGIDRRFKCIGKYHGKITPEMQNSPNYLVDGPLGLNVDILQQNWACKSYNADHSYAVIKGITANRKYQFKTCSVDVVYIDSSIYSCVDDFILDTFDFDFLKNSWDGKSIKIMKPWAIKTMSSSYTAPKLYYRDAKDYNYSSASHFNENEEQDKFLPFPMSHIERQRHRIELYMKRGFTIL